MTDLAKIPEIRPMNGQAFFSFIIPFHPENMWQKNRIEEQNRRRRNSLNYLYYRKNIESLFEHL
jgi:hypothetical protein